ncbi:MAG: rod shape-determining protein RodA [Alphaproteobacteria bacterium]|nr:rod shape-determining protein RodA [Alphaproteobacteria bacterium]
MLDTSFAGAAAPSALVDKLLEINWGLIFFLTLVACIGFAMLYSAAGGSFDPWAKAQMIRFVLGLAVLFIVAMIDPRVWMSLAYPAYGFALLLLIAVFLVGEIGGGARRWLDLGPVNLQPSELMKVTLILALARYFHGLTFARVSNPLFLVPAFLMMALPAALVIKQPDLGTGLLILGIGVGLIFLAGLQWRLILGSLAAAGAAVFAFGDWVWNSLLEEYQRNRILTLFNPELDPQGTGFHIIQAKIALGSGGIWGKGFMQGTQSHLDFLPERQTDFIFSMLAEEFGLMGCVFLMAVYLIILGYGVSIAISTRSHFTRLLAMGVTINFLFYIVINMAMVMGMIPVVGVPLPLVSYGGTAMIVLMFGFGLLMSAHVHRELEIPRAGALF